MTDINLEVLGISILTSSIFILLVVVLRMVFRGKISMRLQYALWLFVAINLLLIPIPKMESALSVQNLLKRDVNSAASQEVMEQQHNVADITFLNQQTAPKMEQSKEQAAESKEIAQTQENTRSVVISIGKIAVMIAMSGSVLMLLYFAFYNLRFGRLLHRQRMAFEGYLSKLPIYLVEGLPSPCLYGKAIYITPEVTTEEKRLEHVITHEYCHYRQGDLWWSALRSICLICYWWNPLVWLAAYLSKQDCELACDEAAIRLLGDEERIPYGETLIGLITVKTKPQDYFSIATTMTGSGKSMKQRILRIAGNQKAVISVCILLVFLVGIGFISMSTAKEQEELPENNTAIEQPILIDSTGIDNEYFSMDVPEDFVNRVSYEIKPDFAGQNFLVYFYTDSFEAGEAGILGGLSRISIYNYDLYGISVDEKIEGTDIENIWNEYVEKYGIGGEMKLVGMSDDKSSAYVYWHPTDVQWSAEKEDAYFRILNELDSVVDSFQEKELVIKAFSMSESITQFLTVFYDADRNGRYSAMITDQSQEALQSIQTYYSELSGFVTKECFDSLMADRLPWSHDKMLAESRAAARVSNIILEDDGKGNYHYRVEICLKRDGVTQFVEAAGEIMIDLETERISQLYEKSGTSYEKALFVEPEASNQQKELTMSQVIAMFKVGSLGDVDYFSFANAEAANKEEAKKNGWLNYYVNFYLPYQGEIYRLGASHNVENDTLEDIYLTRESDMESVLLYTTDVRYIVVEDIEEYLNYKVQMSDLLSIELPQGYTLGNYMANIGINGGALIEPQSYEVKGEDGYGSAIPEWSHSGAISIIKYPQDWFIFEDGKLVDKQMIYWNHTLEEKIEVVEGLAMPAILYHANHDLYTAAESAALMEQGIELKEEELTSDYWYIYFASPESEIAYYLSLDARQFSKEQAIEIAKSVRFAEIGEDIEETTPKAEPTTVFDEEVNTVEGVSMELVEVTPTSAKLTLLNTTDMNIEYGSYYDLQILLDGKWYSLSYIIDNAVFEAIGYMTQKNVPAEVDIDWEIFHGVLAPGQYRIVKEVMDFRGTGDYTEYNLAVEFAITEE